VVRGRKGGWRVIPDAIEGVSCLKVSLCAVCYTLLSLLLVHYSLDYWMRLLAYKPLILCLFDFLHVVYVGTLMEQNGWWSP